MTLPDYTVLSPFPKTVFLTSNNLVLGADGAPILVWTPAVKQNETWTEVIDTGTVIEHGSGGRGIPFFLFRVGAVGAQQAQITGTSNEIWAQVIEQSETWSGTAPQNETWTAAAKQNEIWVAS